MEGATCLCLTTSNFSRKKGSRRTSRRGVIQSYTSKSNLQL